MMPFDRRQNFLYFLLTEVFAYLASFTSYGEKTKLQKTKIGCYGNVPGKFEKNRGSGRSSTAVAEPNGENHVKIRPVEVDIIGLTKTVKNMKHQYNMWLPGWPN